MRCRWLRISALIFALSGLAHANVGAYPSGLLKNFSGQAVSGAHDESSAIGRFLSENFQGMSPRFQWRRISRFQDNTHVHVTYALYYEGRRVLDRHLRVHFNRHGFVEYATSSWEKEFEIALPSRSDLGREAILDAVKRPYMERDGFFAGRVSAEPVVWISPRDGSPVAAFFVRASLPGVKAVAPFVADELTGRPIWKPQAGRFVDVSSRAWTVSPFNATNDLAPVTVTFTGLESATSLKSTYCHVRRQEDVNNPALQEIDPNGATLDGAFSAEPSNYNFECTGDENDCPNQRIDGTNVYHHLSNYRAQVQTYLGTLGVTPIPMASAEPLEVFINAFGLNTDGNNDPEDEVNNAGYFPSGCGSAGGVTIKRCLIFLRPETISSQVCGSNKKFYDLAREALVVVHEYQHFVTDMIVPLTPGGFDPTTGQFLRNVGDSIHEGYSDYFAASQVSAAAGTDETLVGEYAFQNCTFYQRDVGVLRPYQNNSAETDAHVAGLTWASGLWQLRKELGRATGDLLALKSIFFLSANPGFLETVEALVKADKALNAGVNAGRIRQLFYDDLHWSGGASGIFRDSASGLAEVGFKSCNSVPWSGQRGLPSFVALFLWLSAVIGVGRGYRRWGRK